MKKSWILLTLITSVSEVKKAIVARKLILACMLLIVILSGCATYTTPHLPLHDAAYRGDINAVKALLDKGADVNEWNWGTPLTGASSAGKYDVVKLLIDRGADVNMMAQGGWSALGLAAENGHTDIVEFLIDKGADVDKAITGLEQRAAHLATFPNLDLTEIVTKCKRGINLIKEKQKSLPLRTGYACFSKGQFQEAITSLKKGISLDPSNSFAFTVLSACYLENKQLDEAITAAKRAIELKPDNAVAYNNLGAAYGMKKQYDEAIKALKKAIDIDPEMSNAYGLIGRFLVEQNAYNEAVEAYGKAAELAPIKAGYLLKLANTYRLMGRYDDAIAAINKSIALQTFTGIGINSSIEGDYPSVKAVNETGPAKKEEIQIGDKIIKIDGKSTKGWTDEKVVKSLRGASGTQVVLTIERKGAEKTIDKTVPRETIINKEAALSFGLRSFAYRYKGSRDAALKDAEKAYSLDSASLWAQLSLGAAYLDRGKYDESIKLLSQIKDSSTARLLEATAYAKQGKAKEAATIYLSISKETLSPENVPQKYDRMALLQTFKPIVKEHRDKARSFESKGQYKEALSELSEAWKIADDTELQDIQEATFSMIRRNPLLAEMPETARKYALRSEVMLKEGSFEEAATELKKAIQIAPYIARLYYNAALINAELKKYPEAIRNMKIYLKAVPDAPDARAAKDEIYKWEFMMEKEK